MQIDNKTKALLRDPRKRWEWIKYQLKISGTSLAELAAKNGISRQCLYQVRHVPYPKVEALVSSALDVEPKHLFPDRYDEDGLPNRGHTRKYTPPYPAHNVKVVGQN